MTDETQISTQYDQAGTLVARIEAALAALGSAPEAVTTEQLAPLDEFHIGGRAASEHFLDRLGLGPDTRALDVGSGLGGAARFAAQRYGAHVTGIDLTPDFVATGQVLTGWTGLGDRVALVTGSALDMPFDDASFDAAWMIHVGMNIADKTGLARSVARVLRPGAVFGIYDVMRLTDDELVYPVPWADGPERNAIAPEAAYLSALEAAGFTVEAVDNRVAIALDFFAGMMARAQAQAGPQPLGTHLLMGESARPKFANMVANITAGRVAPVEIVARLRRAP